ncbi:MAG: hydrogenase maturation nickel metallochaperone HypA [Planctomycetota bacterium]
MHELSIARSLVRVCEDAARDLGAARVTRVYLRLGPLAGVVREALEFAYDFAVDGTVLAGSELVIEPVPVIVRCDACEADVAPSNIHRLRCPECDAPTPNILSGRELLIRAIDHDDVPSAPSSPSRGAVAHPNPTP